MQMEEEGPVLKGDRFQFWGMALDALGNGGCLTVGCNQIIIVCSRTSGNMHSRSCHVRLFIQEGQYYMAVCYWCCPLGMVVMANRHGISDKQMIPYMFNKLVGLAKGAQPRIGQVRWSPMPPMSKYQPGYIKEKADLYQKWSDSFTPVDDIDPIDPDGQVEDYAEENCQDHVYWRSEAGKRAYSMWV